MTPSENQMQGRAARAIHEGIQNMPPRKTKQEISYEEIKTELADIKQMLAERKHLDDTVKEIKHDLDGNGKPGFKAMRDKVLSWEVKVNAIMLAVIGDVVFRIILMIPK